MLKLEDIKKDAQVSGIQSAEIVLLYRLSL